MGRASSVACMPTASMSGGSLAPIENSPPGIHAMPDGGNADAGTVFAIVASKDIGGATAAAGAAAVARFLAYNTQPATAKSSTAAEIGRPSRHASIGLATAARLRCV